MASNAARIQITSPALSFICASLSERESGFASTVVSAIFKTHYSYSYVSI
jgi:hypothetical protein